MAKSSTSSALEMEGSPNVTPNIAVALAATEFVKKARLDDGDDDSTAFSAVQGDAVPDGTEVTALKAETAGRTHRKVMILNDFILLRLFYFVIVLCR